MRKHAERRTSHFFEHSWYPHAFIKYATQVAYLMLLINCIIPQNRPPRLLPRRSFVAFRTVGRRGRGPPAPAEDRTAVPRSFGFVPLRTTSGALQDALAGLFFFRFHNRGRCWVSGNLPKQKPLSSAYIVGRKFFFFSSPQALHFLSFPGSHHGDLILLSYIT